MIEQGVPVDMEDSNGISSLFHAINKGHSAIVQLLLDYCAPIDVGGWNSVPIDAVVFAVLNNKIDVLRILMRNKVPYNRGSAFLFAIKRRNHDILQLLQPDINKIYLGSRTALHIASHDRFPEAVDILLKAGASASKDDRGYTPRDYARFSGDHEVLRLFDDVYT